MGAGLATGAVGCAGAFGSRSVKERAGSSRLSGKCTSGLPVDYTSGMCRVSGCPRKGTTGARLLSGSAVVHFKFVGSFLFHFSGRC